MPDRKKPPVLYPCRFPVKVIGECSADFEADVLSVLSGYVENINEETIGRRVSAGGKYLSLTITIVAQNREHLETLYAELKAREKVILVL
jgi:putative lipoic acid-binding regulatory protein